LAIDPDANRKLDILVEQFNSFITKQQRLESEINNLKEETIKRLDLMKFDIENIKNDKILTKELEEGRERINQKIEESKKRLTDQENKIFNDAVSISESNEEITISSLEARNKNLDYKTISGYASRLMRYGLLQKERDSSRRINRYILVQKKKG
jgi:predicted transcriptional regulator